MPAILSAARRRFAAPSSSAALGGDAVGAQPVQGVEGPAAQPVADPDDHVDVVGELRLAADPADQTTVTGRHVAGEEVETGELDARVADRTDEGVDLAVGGHGHRERPPELRRCETGVGDGGGPLRIGRSVSKMEAFTV